LKDESKGMRKPNTVQQGDEYIHSLSAAAAPIIAIRLVLLVLYELGQNMTVMIPEGIHQY
jgi:ribonuclease HIII